MKYIIILMLSMSCMIASAQNGSLEYVGDQEILNVWGNNYEMGYGHGYMLNERIVDFFHDMAFNVFGLSVSKYKYVYAQFYSKFDVPRPYVIEARGIIDGIEGAGYSVYSDSLGRELDSTDVLLANSIMDVNYVYGKKSPMACSSFSAWGNPTLEDSILNGTVVMGRNLDFNSSYMMRDNALIITFSPDSAKDFVSFAYPGMISVLSGMNEDMLVVEENMGFHISNTVDSIKYEPFQFTLRDILEQSDYNGNDTVDFLDVFDKCRDVLNSGSWLLHTVYPFIDTSYICAAVIECVNESGDTFRTSRDDKELYPWFLLMLNHEEVNYTPYSDARYNAVLDELAVDSSGTREHIWHIMNLISQSTTIQTMLFMPNDSSFYISFADSFTRASQIYPQFYKWHDLFPNHDLSGIEHTREEKQTQFIYTVKELRLMSIESIYDVNGRRTEMHYLKPGIYFIQIDNSTRKILLIN